MELCTDMKFQATHILREGNFSADDLTDLDFLGKASVVWFDLILRGIPFFF